MPTTRTDIVASCEPVFDRHGFAATGMDTLTEAANVSTRTLYKHLGSKAGLTVAVLEARMERFFSTCTASTFDELLTDLERWIEAEGARGCLFLRAQGEADALSAGAGVSTVVAEYRQRLRSLIGRLVISELGREDETVSDELLIIFEGATSTASYLGPQAIIAARSAASTVLMRGDPCTC
ncbi:TetR/AcrR family transcriptional regulator [Brevibacterium sp. RIT 803]|uniref:TetR/AcrR family transcriptional regulator n=1 Tax=Brevibacterium sp. RIT 803 TaxID=2810210 RepID=UPI00194F1508|nr:TetR/AcrR family transcriptional regulator [Brevibacterium sp. RIT 803]MBM6590513.1 TetR/AcrR family transcriptional regulator [Brevibacterium sp. RIT 803]